MNNITKLYAIILIHHTFSKFIVNNIQSSHPKKSLLNQWHLKKSFIKYRGGSIHEYTTESTKVQLNETNSESNQKLSQQQIKQPPKYKVTIHSISGKRKYMEDEYICIVPETYKEQYLLLAGVFDGHGGSKVSTYLKKNLYPYFQSEIMSSSSSINEFNFTRLWNITTQNDTAAVKRIKRSKLQKLLHDSMNSIQAQPTINTCIKALNQSLCKINDDIQSIKHYSYIGSTSCCVLLHHNYTTCSTTIISANIGDSRAILSHDQNAIDLTVDHKPNNPTERERIEGLGGNVTYTGDIIHPKTKKVIKGIYRMNGNLALSRAIGDRAEKPYVSSTPDISIHTIEPSVDSFIVIASDGLWDVMSSQDVVDYIYDCMIRYDLLYQVTGDDEEYVDDVLRDRVIKDLVNEALRRGSMDNISVIIIWLDYND